MAEELMVVLKRSENSGFGFSLLGSTGPPHVIYDIVENSPAAECGEVEAGDIILKVNGTDVHRYTTKEVLKCLRLSDDLVTLQLKRDPKVKAHIKEYLARTSNQHHYSDVDPPNFTYSESVGKTSSNSSSSGGGGSGSKASFNVTGTGKCGGGAPEDIGQRFDPFGGGGSHRSSSSSSSSVSGSKSLNNSSSSQRGCTSEPLNRPSRIPQAVRSPPTKSAPQSPQNKKTKPSHIPKSNGNNFIINSGGNSFNNSQQQEQQQSSAGPPVGKARFEAYMMTGDLILNLSRTPQSSNLIPVHAKKVDSLRDSPQHYQRQRAVQQSNGALAPRASGESTPSSSPTHSENSDSVNAIGGGGGGVGGNSNDNNKTKDKSSNKISYNNSGGSERLLKDSTTNDTLCELSPDSNDDSLYGHDDIKNDGGCEISGIDKKHLIYSGHSRNRGGVSGGRRARYSSDNYPEEDDDLSACVSSSSSSAVKKRKDKENILEEEEEDESYSADLVDYSKEKEQKLIHKEKEFLSKQQKQHKYRHSHHHHQQQYVSSSSSSTVKSEQVSSPDTSISVPTSPISLSTPLIDCKSTANSVPTSPEQSVPEIVRRQHNGVVRKCDAAGFRTSKSEDHLQQAQRDGIGAVIPIDIDEDVNSSLNTLLDTRQDSEDSQDSNRERIVWTYNAPISYNNHHRHHQHQVTTTTTSPNSYSSSISASPQHSGDSPASPTSVSSSVMSSNSGSKGGSAGNGTNNNSHQNNCNNNNNNNASGNMNAAYGAAAFLQCPINGGDQSMSEAVSNISSPDYQDDDNLLSSKDLVGMALSDPSDSDSTILVSEAMQRKRNELMSSEKEHKIVIQVKGNADDDGGGYRAAGGGNNTNNNSNGGNIRNNQGYSELKDSEDELATLTEDSSPTVLIGGGQDTKESSPPVSDDGSDVDSLHSYHYSPKAVDMPSAVRLAKRLYSLDGFKKSDVSRHLSKNNEFSRAVADEYLKYFNFEKKSLDQALREFLQQFSLSGETQERERVLVHFSKRYLDCNPGSFNSQDAVHTLTCAIMLLNTDLHGQNIGRKMTCSEFVDNLVELNDGENFPKDVLKYLYQAIKNHPLEWALDDDSTDQQRQRTDDNVTSNQIGSNPFLDTPQSSAAIEYKKGYVMRKCCYDSNYKKTPFGKRSWKMFYCTLRDLVLYLHKDEHGFRKNQMSDNVHNAIRIHHALATKAVDYTKKQHVFRLQTADQSEYLFQTSDSKELQSWIDTINFVCASFSAPPLEGGVGSQKRFQRPLLPSTHTKLLIKEQLASHEQQVAQLENALAEHKHGPIPTKGLPLQNYKEKDSYLQYELKRYKTYVSVLQTRAMAEQQQLLESCLLNPDDAYSASSMPHSRILSNAGGGGVPVGGGSVINHSTYAVGQQQQQQQPQQQATNRIIKETTSEN